MSYSCRRSRCSRVRIIYCSVEAEQLSLKGSSFGLIVQIGRWRFWEHRTLDEIGSLLKALHLPVSRRHVLRLYLIGDFLTLLRATQPAKIEA